MNTLLIILLVLAGVFVIFLALGLLMPQEFRIERRIDIGKPKKEVFDYLKYLKNQSNDSKWSMMDPDAKMEFKGTDGTVGFVSLWDSQMKQVGKGEQEITRITEGERVDFALRFLKPRRSNADAYFVTESKGDNQTGVLWGFKGNMKYPINLMRLFMNMDKMVGNDLATGLSNLKTLLEKSK
jgi:hypothetical protein